MNQKNCLKILLVEDNDLDAHLYTKILDQKYHVERCATGEQALKLAKNSSYDVAVVDVNLPKMSGLELVRRLRSRARRDYLGILVLTSDQSRETIEKSLTFGADCFDSKIDAVHLLHPLIESVLRIKTMTDELKDLNRRLRKNNQRLVRKTQLDSLTGLYNMKYMWDQLAYELDRSHNFKTILSVVMIDIDHFKQVNDSGNHVIGSFVIQEVARILEGVSRDTDLVGRYGGDEYFLILPDTDTEGASLLTNRIKDKVGQRVFSHGKDNVQVTLSQGIATYSPFNRVKCSLDELVKLADGALYEAKRQGRNCVASATFDEPREDLILSDKMVK